MVNFIQKNAAKIVIIAGAALISSIGGGCKCDPQKSTKSQKCVDATEKQKDECQKHSQKPTTNKNLLCEGETCDAAKDFKKDGICCETPVIEGKCEDVFSKQDTKNKTTCKDNKVPSSEYKCNGACDKIKDADKCCVAERVAPTPDCTKASDDAACKVKKCIADQFRVLGAAGGCTKKCAKQDGTTIERSECACAHAEETDVTKVATCRAGETCKAEKGTKGTCALPTCAAAKTAGYASNCLYANGAKNCGKDEWFNGTKCIYKKCTENAYTSEECSCTKSDHTVKLVSDATARNKQLQFCARGHKCSFTNNEPSCTEAVECNATVHQNCSYKLEDSAPKQFCLGDYYWSNEDKICGLKCPDQSGANTNASACMCLADGQEDFKWCDKDHLFCKKATSALADKCKDAAN